MEPLDSAERANRTLLEQVIHEGRLADAACEYVAAAVAGNAEGMHSYVMMLLKGQGVMKNIPECARWLEKAATIPESTQPHENVGIAAAMCSLGNLFDDGIFYILDKIRAREYWKRAAKHGHPAGSCNVALCLIGGTHGVVTDLPRARDLLRRSAESFCVEAMGNLANLHASLQEYDTAARWEDTASTFGLTSVPNNASKYRQMAKMMEHISAGSVNNTDNFMTMMKTTDEAPVAKVIPSIEVLRTFGSPFCQRLRSAKEKIMQARTLMVEVRDLNKIVAAIQLATQAYRIEGNHFVFTMDEVDTVAMAAEFLLDAGFKLNEDLALCLGVAKPASQALSFWKSMQTQFPNDVDILWNAVWVHTHNASSITDRDYTEILVDKTLSLVPHIDDDNDPRAMRLLYGAGVLLFKGKLFSRAHDLFTRFLKYAVADGHPMVVEVNFILGAVLMLELELKETAPHLTMLEERAREHLRVGIALDNELPAFLRQGQELPVRKGLEEILGVTSPPTTDGLSDAAEGNAKRGGELLRGPRRHAELRSKSSMLSAPWRKNLVDLMEKRDCVRATKNGFSNFQTPPETSRLRISPIPTVPATIDELFSELKDRMYKGRSITCVVVSTPMFTASAFQMIVEDSQREPSRLALYNADSSLIGQLLPGQTLVLIDPYVRITSDKAFILRVDNPDEAIQLKAKHSICWACALEDTPRQPLKSCAKCKTALYCSKKCKKQDWAVYGHRYVCETFEKQRRKSSKRAEKPVDEYRDNAPSQIERFNRYYALALQAGLCRYRNGCVLGKEEFSMLAIARVLKCGLWFVQFLFSLRSRRASVKPVNYRYKV